MKKAILILFCASMMIVSFSSCKKKCKCKTYVDGVVHYERDYEVQKGKKCKDMSHLYNVNSLKTGVECK